MNNHCACDQYGTWYHNLGQHPRKELIKRLGCQHVSKMYRDRKDGSSVHVGYVVGRYWCTIFEIERWSK